MSDVSISTFAELQAFLEREGLQLRQGKHPLSPAPKRWWAKLEKFSSSGIQVATYQGTGDDMLGAIVDAIRCMYDQRRARPLQFTKE